MTGFEVWWQFEFTDGKTFEFCDLVAEGTENAAHLVELSFEYGDFTDCRGFENKSGGQSFLLAIFFFWGKDQAGGGAAYVFFLIFRGDWRCKPCPVSFCYTVAGGNSV